METFARGVAMLSRTCGVVAGALIVVSVLVITDMVVLRYGFGEPTIWQTEFVIYALVATTLLGSPYVLLHRGHVNMDIVVLAAAPRLRFWMAVIADLLSLGFCLTLTLYGVAFWHEAWSSGLALRQPVAGAAVDPLPVAAGRFRRIDAATRRAVP